MLIEDVRRLERERTIYMSTRGPDYSQIEHYIRRAHEEATKGKEAYAEVEKRKKMRWMDIGEL